MKLEMLKQRFGDRPLWGVYYADRVDQGWQTGMTLTEAEELLRSIRNHRWGKRAVLYFVVEIEVHDDLD